MVRSIARNGLGPAGQGMRSASYQLTQTGRAADPIWEVWAYGSANRYLGVVKLSARSGNVISSKKAGSRVFENRRNFCRPVRWFSVELIH